VDLATIPVLPVFAILPDLISISMLLLLVVLPAYVATRLAQAKRLYPVWVWTIVAVFFSWLAVVVVLLIPRRATNT
jgi:hypothetical protein